MLPISTFRGPFSLQPFCWSHGDDDGGGVCGGEAVSAGVKRVRRARPQAELGRGCHAKRARGFA